VFSEPEPIIAVNIWWLRVAWVTLPITAGWAVAEAVASWSTPTRVVAAVLLWAMWGVVLVAVLAPHPLSLTAVRTAAPLALVVVILVVVSGRASTVAEVVAVMGALTCAVIGGSPEIGITCAQGSAYGDEERFPLAVPPALFLGVLPLAVLAVGTGLAAGPLLLAAGAWAAGITAILVGLPLAALALRPLHQLSRRWLVLVPAGVVVHDPMTLTDPYLFTREHIAGLGPADPATRPPERALDLRLGAARGSLALLLDQETDVQRRSRNRGVGVRTNLLLVAPVASRRVLARAEARRISVRHRARKRA